MINYTNSEDRPIEPQNLIVVIMIEEIRDARTRGQ